MRLSVLCAWVGAAWGLVFGVAAALAVMALGAGVSWLFLFGDDPWPPALAWLLPALGAVSGVAVLAGGIAAGLAFGRRAERRPPAEAAAIRRWARALLALALLTIAAGGALALAGERREADRREAAARGQGDFAALVSGRQVLGAVTVEREGRDGGLRVSLEVRGRLGGRYELSWAVRETAYRKVLAEGRLVRHLAAGGNRLAFSLDLLALARSYHREVLGGRAAAVLVDEDFRLELALTPLLDEAARAALPPHERQNLALGESPLMDRARVSFPVRFEIRGGEVTLPR